MSEPQLSLLPDNYDYIRPIGSGGHSEVFLYLNRETDVDVAIKVVNKSKVCSWYNEIEIMKHLSGTVGVSDYITHYEDDKYYCIVMAYIEGVDLLEYINECESSSHEIPQIITMMLQTIKVVHDKGIVHRDIKPENFIIYRNVINGNLDNTCLTLIDYSVSCFTDKEVSDSPCGSLAYLSPEVYNKCSKQSFSSDMWAIGVTIFALLAKRLPFFTSPISNVNLNNYDECYSRNVCSLSIIWDAIPLRFDVIWLKLINKLLTLQDNRLTATQALVYINKKLNVKKRKRKIQLDIDSINNSRKKQKLLYL